MTSQNEPKGVAVTVFVTVTDAAGDTDVETVAEVTVREALRTAGAGGTLACPLRPHPGQPAPQVRVVSVMETARASRSGFLVTSASPYAFHEKGQTP